MRIDLLISAFCEFVLVGEFFFLLATPKVRAAKVFGELAQQFAGRSFPNSLTGKDVSSNPSIADVSNTYLVVILKSPYVWGCCLDATSVLDVQ